MRDPNGGNQKEDFIMLCYSPNFDANKNDFNAWENIRNILKSSRTPN